MGWLAALRGPSKKALGLQAIKSKSQTKYHSPSFSHHNIQSFFDFTSQICHQSLKKIFWKIIFRQFKLFIYFSSKRYHLLPFSSPPDMIYWQSARPANCYHNITPKIFFFSLFPI
jgi:hypothetical protein